jgi:hypothetical protein
MDVFLIQVLKSQVTAQRREPQPLSVGRPKPIPNEPQRLLHLRHRHCRYRAHYAGTDVLFEFRIIHSLHTIDATISVQVQAVGPCGWTESAQTFVQSGPAGSVSHAVATGSVGRRWRGPDDVTAAPETPIALRARRAGRVARPLRSSGRSGHPRHCKMFDERAGALPVGLGQCDLREQRTSVRVAAERLAFKGSQ